VAFRVFSRRMLLGLDSGSLHFSKDVVEHGPGFVAGSLTGPVAAAVQMTWKDHSVRLLPDTEALAGCWASFDVCELHSRCETTHSLPRCTAHCTSHGGLLERRSGSQRALCPSVALLAHATACKCTATEALSKTHPCAFHFFASFDQSAH
jgi:hypothetical protein